MSKLMIGKSVFEAAQERIAWVFDTFPKIYVSFSGGKDSTVMTHLVASEAKKRGRKIGLLFVDLEAQYKLTIDHVREMFDLYADIIEPHWCSLPIHLRNAVSQYQPHWICWDQSESGKWVRQPDKKWSKTGHSEFPFFKPGMEFEEFVPEFGHWFGQEKLTACFVGIRTAESLNRWRTVAGHGTKMDGKGWTNYCGKTLYNIYPIYDWKTEDIWTYHAKTGNCYNRLYDLMHKAGLTIHQMRICQPYGDDQRKGLWLFHLIEPETWGKVIARVAGANSGALYCQETGNINGTIKIQKPDGHTWQSFAHLLIESQPPKTQEHFRNKITVFLKWWIDRGYPNGIPDEASIEDEAKRKAPSWRRVCKALLRNDYWCKGLSFTQTKSPAYDRYCKIMKKRRNEWKIRI